MVGGCDNVCGSTAVEDCAGVCGGDSVEDCAGVCGGDAVVGGCDNVCGSTAVEDCAGVCGGDAYVDDCGVCDGMNASQDCAGVCDGTAEYDDYGVCGGTNECLSSSPIPQNTFTILSNGQVLYHSTNDMVGFQFDINWCSDTNLCPANSEENSISSVSGGDTENWTIQFSNNSDSSEILGFFIDDQLNDYTLSAGCGVLMVLDFTGNVHSISDGDWSGPGAVPLNLTFDECDGCENQLGSEYPNMFILSQNYPNPFNPITNIEFTTFENSFVRLVVFDINGRHVKTLISNYLVEGSHEVKWDAKNSFGKEMPSGVYIYQLTTNNMISSKRMTLLR